MTEKNLVEKRELLSALQEELAVLRDHYTAKEEQCRHLQGEIDQCTLHNGRAAKLLHSLKAEKQKWTVLNRIIMDKFINLEGDCLLGAAISIYLSPLNAQYRDYFHRKWQSQLINNMRIKISGYYNFIKLFGDQIEIKRWVVHRLPPDNISIQNALIYSLSPIQTLLLDPQYQANAWIKSKHADNTDELSLLILQQHNARFLPVLRACIKYGKTALVENVGQDVTRAIYPLLMRDLSRIVRDRGDDAPVTTDRASAHHEESVVRETIVIDGVEVVVHEDFRLCITSELATPRFSSEVALYCNMINFALSEQALESQLLGIFVAERMGKLERAFHDTKLRTLECIEKLHTIEELILDALSKDVDTLLEDDRLIEHLAMSYV